jgi:hypothetical protein
MCLRYRMNRAHAATCRRSGQGMVWPSVCCLINTWATDCTPGNSQPDRPPFRWHRSAVVGAARGYVVHHRASRRQQGGVRMGEAYRRKSVDSTRRPRNLPLSYTGHSRKIPRPTEQERSRHRWLNLIDFVEQGGWRSEGCRSVSQPQHESPPGDACPDSASLRTACGHPPYQRDPNLTL